MQAANNTMGKNLAHASTELPVKGKSTNETLGTEKKGEKS